LSGDVTPVFGAVFSVEGCHRAVLERRFKYSQCKEKQGISLLFEYTKWRKPCLPLEHEEFVADKIPGEDSDRGNGT
jgi:hypothetical protein